MMNKERSVRKNLCAWRVKPRRSGRGGYQVGRDAQN